MATVERISDTLTIVVPEPGERPRPTGVDSWALGRARLVVFKTQRLLADAQRELGAFGEGALSADLAPDLLRASELVGDALAVLEQFGTRLDGRDPESETPSPPGA